MSKLLSLTQIKQQQISQEMILQKSFKPKQLKENKDKCLLITTLQGTICFSYGEKVFEFSHTNILGKNFFNDIITPYSNISLNQQFQDGEILPPQKNQIYFACQVKKNSKICENLIKVQQQNSEDKTIYKSLLYSIYQNLLIRCTRIYSNMKIQSVQLRKIDILPINMCKTSQCEEFICLQICKIYNPELYKFYENDPLINEMKTKYKRQYVQEFVIQKQDQFDEFSIKKQEN